MKSPPNRKPLQARRFSVAQRIWMAEVAAQSNLPLVACAKVLGISASYLCTLRQRVERGGALALLPKERKARRDSEVLAFSA